MKFALSSKRNEGKFPFDECGKAVEIINKSKKKRDVIIANSASFNQREKSSNRAVDVTRFVLEFIVTCCSLNHSSDYSYLHNYYNDLSTLLNCNCNGCCISYTAEFQE